MVFTGGGGNFDAMVCRPKTGNSRELKYISLSKSQLYSAANKFNPRATVFCPVTRSFLAGLGVSQQVGLGLIPKPGHGAVRSLPPRTCPFLEQSLISFISITFVPRLRISQLALI